MSNRSHKSRKNTRKRIAAIAEAAAAAQDLADAKIDVVVPAPQPQ